MSEEPECYYDIGTHPRIFVTQLFCNG